ncbi:MAG: LysM peptidoglycan-binding domain-containing protein [Deltaproteobacteria bacterium]|nr:LysM peptidoglycan-binding domain-containing protein [Deltaproteobacteria bacterium]
MGEDKVEKRSLRGRCAQILLLSLSGLFVFPGCGTLGHNGVVQEESAGKAGQGRWDREAAVLNMTGEARDRARPGYSDPAGKDGTPQSPASRASHQEMIDSALELLQASSDYWEQGNHENAVDALDKAYSLILQVETDDDPDLIQQREDLRITIAKRIVEVYASRFTVANGTYKAIPLVMNDHVKREIASFTGREKDFFLSAYRRSGKYRPAILKALEEAGMPKELSWLPLIESGFKVRAFSRARALGLWQFIASTGYKYGLKRDTWIDERMDPEKSTMAAIAYLKDLHQMFGDWTTALAGYNCGEWAVLNRIKTQRINYLDHFWDLYEKLPRETAAYVPRLLAVLHIVNNPEAHGVALPHLDEEIRVEEVTINKKVQLKTIAARLDVDCDLLQELNAELRQDMTPDSPYPLKVPKGKGDVLLAKLSDIPESNVHSFRRYSSSPSYLLHTVKKGETLASIARKYKTTTKAIKGMNGLGKGERVNVGWTLKIPTQKGYAPVLAGKASAADSRPTSKVIEYVVKPGDSLWKIAGRYNTTTKNLRTLNKLSSPNLREGQVLMILPGPGTTNTTKTKTYKVKDGDSPSHIARKHDMDLSEFLKLNNLSPKSTIFPGQVVQVMGR